MKGKGDNLRVKSCDDILDLRRKLRYNICI